MAHTKIGFKYKHRLFGRGKSRVVIEEGNNLPGDISCFTELLSIVVEMHNTCNKNDLQHLCAVARDGLKTAQKREYLGALLYRSSPRLQLDPEAWQTLEKQYLALGGTPEQGTVGN